MILPVLAGLGALCMSNPRRRKRRKARRNPGRTDPRQSVYAEGFKLPKHSGTVSVLSAHTASDAKKILKRLFPTWTKADHLSEMKKHLGLSQRYARLWDRTADHAAKATFGRPWQFSDYKISAIGRDEFATRYKNVLRMAARRTGDHEKIALSHAKAAGLSKLPGRDR